MTFVVRLPWSPTANTYYRMVMMGACPRMLISKRGREYRDTVCAMVKPMLTRGPYPIMRPVIIHMEATPPDARKRDIDNLLKPLIDSLTHAGVWKDDSQLDEIMIRRLPIVPGEGSVLVTVTEAP